MYVCDSVTNKLFSNGRNCIQNVSFLLTHNTIKSQPPNYSKIRYLSSVNEFQRLWMF